MTEGEQTALLSVLGCRMLRLIETHSESLARGLLTRIENNERCRDFIQKVPRDELQQRIEEIYHHLGEWLTQKTEAEIERRYVAIGERRASQGVSLSHLMYVIVATKEHLWEYVAKEVLNDPRPLELFQEMELFQLVEQFFDRAVYFAAIGYEKARTGKAETAKP